MSTMARKRMDLGTGLGNSHIPMGVSTKGNGSTVQWMDMESYFTHLVS